MRQEQQSRQARRRDRVSRGVRAPRRNRKIALAASVSVMTLNTAAIDLSTSERQVAQLALSDASTDRQPSSSLTASDELKEAMIEEEGVRYTVYRDAGGLPTVGVGHLVTAADNLSVGQEISERRALELFERDLASAERAVAAATKDIPLYQHEFDALVDLAFNVGGAVFDNSRSPRLAAAIAAQDYQSIADELAYHNARGVLAPGLVYRSERRTNMFEQASYADPRMSNI